MIRKLLYFSSLFLFRSPSVCAHGLFGQDCANKCNDKCDGCNNVNGLCDSGCQPGWTGIDCRTGMHVNLI